MPVEFSGFDEIQKKFKDMARRAEKLHGEHDVKLTELFPPAFMTRYTRFATIEQMFEQSPIQGELEGDAAAALEAQEWNAFVEKHTQFTSWEEMLDEAKAKWVKGRMGL